MTVSHVEWVQDVQSYLRGEAEISRPLEHVLQRAFDVVREAAARHGTGLGVLLVAVVRVAGATRRRGVYP